MAPLSPDGDWQRLPWLAARQERQVIAHDIDGHRRQHKNQADPEPGATMRALPVSRARVGLNTVVFRRLLVLLHF